jgi:hypothetical protein
MREKPHSNERNSSRRNFLKRLTAICAAALPVMKLGETAARAARRRRHHRGDSPDEIWIGHC